MPVESQSSTPTPVINDFPRYAPLMTRDERVAWRRAQDLPDEWFHDDDTMYVKDEFLDVFTERVRAFFEHRS